MEDVWWRRIVDDDDSLELSTEPTEVLNVVPSMEDAGFAEKAWAKDAPLIQKVRHRVGVLGQWGRE